MLRIVRTAAVVILLVLCPWAAVAQTHPCDTPAPTTFREPSAQLPNLKIGFCHDGKDADGVLIELPLTFSVTIGTNAPIDLGVLTPILGPNAQGYSYYEVVVPGLAAGTIYAKALAAGLGESAGSPPITLTLLGPPKPPTNLRIIRGGGAIGPPE